MRRGLGGLRGPGTGCEARCLAWPGLALAHWRGREFLFRLLNLRGEGQSHPPTLPGFQLAPGRGKWGSPWSEIKGS